LDADRLCKSLILIDCEPTNVVNVRCMSTTLGISCPMSQAVAKALLDMNDKGLERAVVEGELTEISDEEKPTVQ
jgi:hypothetical protein